MTAVEHSLWLLKPTLTRTQASQMLLFLGSLVEGVSLALAPFWKSQDEFWPSKQLFSTRELGYTYPEFSSVDQYAGGDLTHAAGTVLGKYIETSSMRGLFTGPESEFWWSWSARIRTRKFELGHSFSILIFLGAVPADSAHWTTDENFVGAHHVFANSAVERCRSCRDNLNANAVNEGFVHLNHYIYRRWRPPAGLLAPADYQRKLMDKLQWRVTDVCLGCFEGAAY